MEKMKPFVKLALRYGLVAAGAGGAGLMLADNPGISSLAGGLGVGDSEAALEAAVTEGIIDVLADGICWFCGGVWDVVCWPFVKAWGLF